MDLRLLGPLEVRLGNGPVELGPRKQRAVLAMLALRVGRTVSADRARRGPVGRGPAGERAEDGAALRVAPAARAGRRRRESSPTAAATSSSWPSDDVDAVRFERLRGASRARATRSRSGTATRSRTSPTSRSPRRRDPPPRGAAATGGGDRDRRRPRGRAARGRDRRARARSSRRNRCASTSMPSGCSRCTATAASRRRLPPTGRAHARSWSEIGVEPGAELRALHEQVLGAGSGARPARGARARSGAGAAAAAARRSRRLLVAAAAVLLAGHRGVRPHPGARARGPPAASTRTASASSTGRRPHHRAVRGRPRARRRDGRRRLGVGREPARRDRLADRWPGTTRS